MELVPGADRIVAVKVMHEALHADKPLMADLLDEARLVSKIRHANVIPIIDTVQEDGVSALILEYVEGVPLSVMLQAARKRGATLPIAVVGAIIVDVLRGLHAAHELRDETGKPLELVHRDVTPHNVLVGVDGVARLTDFGIAKTLSSYSHTASGIVKGKPTYMAPEQARAGTLDRRADLWSTGVMLWEALVGKRPFAGGTPATTLARLATVTKAPKVRAERPEVPSEIEAVVLQALATDTARRFSDAAAFCQQLTAAWETVGGLASKESER